MSLLYASCREDDLCARLREACVNRINEIGVPRAAELMGLLPSGVRCMLRRRGWDLQDAFRAMEDLGCGSHIAGHVREVYQ